MKSTVLARSPNGINEGYLKKYFVKMVIPLKSDLLNGFEDLIPRDFLAPGAYKKKKNNKEGNLTQGKSNYNQTFSVTSVSGKNLNKEFLLKKSEHKIHFSTVEDNKRLQLRLDKMHGSGFN